MDSEFPYYVKSYYTEDVKPPKVPGELAIETKHKTEASRDLEIAGSESREDIGIVIWGWR